jgi:hypothetical protein
MVVLLHFEISGKISQNQPYLYTISTKYQPFINLQGIQNQLITLSHKNINLIFHICYIHGCQPRKAGKTRFKHRLNCMASPAFLCISSITKLDFTSGTGNSETS